VFDAIGQLANDAVILLALALCIGKCNNHNNNNIKHAYACAADSFIYTTYIKVLLVLTDRGVLVQSN
jgi:hypothetical protein